MHRLVTSHHIYKDYKIDSFLSHVMIILFKKIYEASLLFINVLKI